MASTPRFFTLEEANDALPKVKALVARQLDRRARLEQLIAELGKRLGEPPEAIVVHPDDPSDLKAFKREVIARVEEYQRGWNELEDMGAVLKDPKTGLIDFYSKIEGKTVLLCWRHGEDSIEHYHTPEAGFAGRKPLAAVRRRLYN
jgi:hypothetical protein